MIEESKRLAKAAFATGDYQGEYHTFSSLTQLLETFTPKRLTLMHTLQQIGPSSLRGLARAVGRDVKRVHEDVAALLNERVVERDEQKKLMVPFKEIHIRAEIKAPKAA